tara:strand:+ start:306 stop:2696 length:2391 start_codon:yes stop_codon:yes gene_type:complete
MSSSSAAFNIIFGANTSGLDKALISTEKRLLQTSRKLERMGGKLTSSVTVPLLAIGAAVVKSAIDMESLNTSFISLTGGAEQAGAMVKKLSDFSASTPFQIEGIATAARQLIATGTGLNEVSNTLGFLGDIAAASGSQIEEIAAIFSKVKAKGKVELESLNQLAERGIPIFTMLSEATGLTADKLGAGAVSVEQFEEVLRSMSAEGGLAHNAMYNLSQTTGGKLSTAFDNLKLAAAELGAEMLPVLNDIVDKVTGWAKSFAALDTSTKKNIINVGLFAAAAGPMLIAIGKMIKGYQQLTKAIKLATIAKSVTPLGLVTTALALGGAAFLAFRDDAEEADKAVEGFNSRLERTKENLDTLTFEALADEAEKAVLRIVDKFDDVFSKDDWIELIDNVHDEEGLKKNNARFLKEIERVEAEIVERLAGKRNEGGYLVKQFGFDQAKKELAALEEAMLISNKAIEGFKEKNKETPIVETKTEREELTELEKLLARVEEQKARISAVDLFTPDEIQKQQALAAALHDAAVSAQLLGATELAKEYEAEADAADDLASSLEKANEERQRQIDLVNLYGESVNGLLSYLGSYGVLVQDNKEIEEEATNTSEAFSNMLVQGAQAIGGAVSSVNDALREQQSTLSEQYALGELTAEEYHAKLAALEEQAKHERRSAVMEAIGQMLVQATAQAITNAYQSAAATGPAAAAMGPILAGAAVAGITSLWASSFARGGMVTGETLAVVGDNQSGKEAIIPFERMGEFLGKFGGGGGAQHIVVSGKLSGSDILLSAERSKRSLQRVTGVTF